MRPISREKVGGEREVLVVARGERAEALFEDREYSNELVETGVEV